MMRNIVHGVYVGDPLFSEPTWSWKPAWRELAAGEVEILWKESLSMKRAVTTQDMEVK